MRFQRLEPQARGVGKAANRGEKRPEQRGQKRQQGSNRVDKAVSEHTARSPFIGGHELQDTLRIWQLFRRREYAGHLGRPPPHERPRAARARPTPAPSCAPMSLKPLLVGGGVLAVHLGVRPPACRTAYRLRSGPYRDFGSLRAGRKIGSTPEITGLMSSNARQINRLRSRSPTPSGTFLREANRPLRERAGRESLDMTRSRILIIAS